MANPTNRRDFLFRTSLASLTLFISSKSLLATASQSLVLDKPNSKFSGVQVGAITYSWRSLPSSPAQILQYCIDSNISAIELMGDSIEVYAGKPENTIQRTPRVPGQPRTVTEEQKKQEAIYQQQLADWRASVSMDAFTRVRKMFKKAGVSIYAFKPSALEPKNTDAEIEYALRAAKALGAKSVTIELPKDPAHSKRLGELGAKHKVYIGYHTHTQATDTSWDIALSQSPYNSMNLDCGHYIAAGGKNTKESLLALIEAKHDRITSMHMKDRRSKENGGANVVWGLGETPIKEILTLLKEKKYPIPATIELEYDIPAGSDPVQETKKCVEYAKNVLGVV
jgi:sugar phosphate isomerase/epimerase